MRNATKQLAASVLRQCSGTISILLQYNPNSELSCIMVDHKLSATKCKQHICYCWWLLSSCSQSVTTSGQLENCPRLWIKDRPTALPSMLTLTHDLDFLSMASCIYDPYTCRNQGGQVFQKECKQMSRGDFITVLTNVIGNY